MADTPAATATQLDETEMEDSAPETQVAEPSTVNLSELTPLPQEDSTPAVAPAPGIPDPVAKLEQEVKQALAAHLDLDISAIEVVSIESVTWRDGSIGCPQPGMMYTQGLVPGYRIVLEANGRAYTYHTRSTTYYILCEDPDPNGAIDPTR